MAQNIDDADLNDYPMNMDSKKIVKSNGGEVNKEKVKKYNSEIREVKRPKSNVNAKPQLSQINTVRKNEGDINSSIKTEC